MKRVSISLYYDEESRPMIESALESFAPSCIAYGSNVRFEISDTDNASIDVCKRCGKYISDIKSCKGCPLEFSPNDREVDHNGKS